MNKEDRKCGEPIDWTHEMDVALIKSFMGDMHNFFVFCRTHHIFVEEGFDRADYLKESKDYDLLKEEAKALYESQRVIREKNLAIANKIVAKRVPASAEDKAWLARSEW